MKSAAINLIKITRRIRTSRSFLVRRKLYWSQFTKTTITRLDKIKSINFLKLINAINNSRINN